MTPAEIKLINQAASSAAIIQSMASRLARMESRLTQLMLFQGMQTDGRTQLNNREMRNVV